MARYPVGSLVKACQDDHKGGIFYRAGNKYRIIKTDADWNYIEKEDGSGLIGVADFVLEPLVDECHPMIEPEFSLDEIELANKLIGNE